MAQKELLCILAMFLFFAPSFSYADVEEKIFFKNIINNALNMTLENIREKFLELKQMQAIDDKTKENEALFNDLALKVFVSSSMPKELLKYYIEEARKYKASLIFNGLINNSWLETQKFMMSLIKNEKEGVPFLINDEDFREFNITSVPSIVLVKEEQINFGLELEESKRIFDKVTGNIGIKGALMLFADDGNLANDARNILEGDN